MLETVMGQLGEQVVDEGKLVRRRRQRSRRRRSTRHNRPSPAPASDPLPIHTVSSPHACRPLPEPGERRLVGSRDDEPACRPRARVGLKLSPTMVDRRPSRRQERSPADFRAGRSPRAHERACQGHEGAAHQSVAPEANRRAIANEAAARSAASGPRRSWLERVHQSPAAGLCSRAPTLVPQGVGTCQSRPGSETARGRVIHCRSSKRSVNLS